MAMSREAPSLVKLCVGTVIANLRYVGDVSGVDLHLLKDILPHCTMDQLICIENSTQEVDLSPVTNDLWKRFYEQQFGEENMMLVVKRMKQKRVVFKWKKLYEAKIKEREVFRSKSVERLKQRYEEELAKKQSKQIQICSKIPPSGNKRNFSSVSSSYKVSHIKGNLMKKAKLEYLKSREACIRASMRKNFEHRKSLPSQRFYCWKLSNDRMVLFQFINESSQPRRGRRRSRVARRRCLIWTFLLSIMSLIYLSFVGSALLHKEKGTLQVPGFPTSGMYSQGRNAAGTSESTTSHQTIIQIVKISKDKSHKKHGPCEVSFTKSVEYLVQPENYMNFTKFSLDYVLQEQQHYSNNSMIQPKFGGHQTLEERENSYYARNETLHCGFVKGPEEYPSTGFDVNEKDKEYMDRCRVAVSSCIFGSSDFLRRPTSKLIGKYSKKSVCFMMFLDELTMRKLSLEGQVPDDEGYIGLWKIVLVKKLPYTDMRKTGKVPKFLSHRLFPSAWYSIWIDSKMRLQTDPMLILEYFLWRKKSEYAISNHYDRHCVWEEVDQNKRLNKYNHSAIDEQFQFYQSDGLVKFNESDSSAPLPSYVPEGSFIVRAHTPMSNLFSCLWFNEVDRFTSRDQLSFAYTFLKLRRMNPGKPFFLNMFKDCERRAMAKIFHHRVENTSSPGT